MQPYLIREWDDTFSLASRAWKDGAPIPKGKVIHEEKQKSPRGKACHFVASPREPSCSVKKADHAGRYH